LVVFARLKGYFTIGIAVQARKPGHLFAQATKEVKHWLARGGQVHLECKLLIDAEVAAECAEV
jgi:hypothetical protein